MLGAPPVSPHGRRPCLAGAGASRAVAARVLTRRVARRFTPGAPSALGSVDGLLPWVIAARGEQHGAYEQLKRQEANEFKHGPTLIRDFHRGSVDIFTTA